MQVLGGIIAETGFGGTPKGIVSISAPNGSRNEGAPPSSRRRRRSSAPHFIIRVPFGKKRKADTRMGYLRCCCLANFNPHPSGMRLETRGTFPRPKNSPPDCFYPPCGRAGLSSPFRCKKKSRYPKWDICFSGTPKGTRTPDLLIRSQSLYPTELSAHVRIT